jgi:diadenosine tetraphosphate (Ap4A) HIT family hydrolase
MMSGPATRTRATQKRYHRALRAAAKKGNKRTCDFCDFTNLSPQVKHEFPNFWLVQNIYGYHVWDGQGVSEHLMLVPKIHVVGINELDPELLKEYAELIADFEAKGYSLYSRAPVNALKSVSHQHTHLIKFDNKLKKVHIHVRKPHVMIHI